MSLSDDEQNYLDDRIREIAMGVFRPSPRLERQPRSQTPWTQEKTLSPAAVTPSIEETSKGSVREKLQRKTHAHGMLRGGMKKNTSKDNLKDLQTGQDLVMQTHNLGLRIQESATLDEVAREIRAKLPDMYVEIERLVKKDMPGVDHTRLAKGLDLAEA